MRCISVLKYIPYILMYTNFSDGNEGAYTPCCLFALPVKFPTVAEVFADMNSVSVTSTMVGVYISSRLTLKRFQTP